MSMTIEFEGLKCATLLVDGGWSQEQAETLVRTLIGTPIFNLYSVKEVDSMLAQTVQNTWKQFDKFEDRFARYENQVDKQIAANKAEFERRMELDEQRMKQNEEHFQKEMEEAKSSRRFLIWSLFSIAGGLLTLAGVLVSLHLIH